MKKKFSFIILFLFLLYLSNIQLLAYQTKGKSLISDAKGNFYKGEFKEAIGIFIKALNFSLSDKDKIEAHLYLGICWLALNAVNKGEEHFKEIIKINPEYVFKKENFPPEIKKIFDETKYEFPIIYDFSVFPDLFYPYKGEKPYFNFHMTSPDCVDLNISNKHQLILKDRKCFKNHGIQSFEWKWKDKLIRINEINVELTPEKNKKE